MKEKGYTEEDMIGVMEKAFRGSKIDYETQTSVMTSVMEQLFLKETLDEWPSGWEEGQRGSLDGMWADVWFPEQRESQLRILSAANWDPEENTALVYWPGNDKNAAESEVLAENVKPRFDLQRAWEAHGGPVGTEEDKEKKAELISAIERLEGKPRPYNKERFNER